MITSLIYVVVVCAIAALVLWAVRELEVPHPLGNVVRVVVIVIAILVVIAVVAGLFGVDVGLPIPRR